MRTLNEEQLAFIYNGIDEEYATGFRLNAGMPHETLEALRRYTEVLSRQQHYTQLERDSARDVLFSFYCFWRDYFTKGKDVAVREYKEQERKLMEKAAKKLSDYYQTHGGKPSEWI